MPELKPTLPTIGQQVPANIGENELNQVSSMSSAMVEIQSAIMVAKGMPRSEDVAFDRLMRACKRPTFADSAEYQYPRGGATIVGPSVNLAREAARCWGNIRYGLEIVRDTEDERQIRGWAWDMETNVKVEAEDAFKKLIYRKTNGGEWIKPDERELRELTNRRGAIVTRNAILQVLPRDLIEDAQNKCRDTIKAKITEDPEAARKRIILGFQELHVSAKNIEAFLGHEISECSPKELQNLRSMYQAIRDGAAKWTDFVEAKDDLKADNKADEKKQKPKARARVRKSKAEKNEKSEPPTPTEPPAEKPKSNGNGNGGSTSQIKGQIISIMHKWPEQQKMNWIGSEGFESVNDLLASVSDVNSVVKLLDKVKKQNQNLIDDGFLTK